MTEGCGAWRRTAEMRWERRTAAMCSGEEAVAPEEVKLTPMVVQAVEVVRRRRRSERDAKVSICFLCVSREISIVERERDEREEMKKMK